MSDTPRTDAVLESTWGSINVPTNPIPADFAKQLEREIAEARKERDTLAEALRKCVLWAECMSMRCERDRDNINWSYLNDAHEALAAVKGGQHDA